MSDNSLELNGYNLILVDHPNDTKRGGVCIYDGEPLPVRVISTPYLKEAILSQMSHSSKKIFVSVVCFQTQINENHT